MKIKEIKVSPEYNLIDLALKFLLAISLLALVGLGMEYLNMLVPVKDYLSQLGRSANHFLIVFGAFFASFLVCDLLFSIHSFIKFLRYTIIISAATSATALFYNFTLKKNILTNPDFFICVGPILVMLMLAYIVQSVYIYYQKIKFKKIKSFQITTPTSYSSTFSTVTQNLITSSKELSSLENEHTEEEENSKRALSVATLQAQENWVHSLDPNQPKMVAYDLFSHRFKSEYIITIRPSFPTLITSESVQSPPQPITDVYFEPGKIIVSYDKKQYVISALPAEILEYFENIEEVEALYAKINCQPQSSYAQ